MLHTAIFAAAVSAADASGQCTSPSYDFCCQIGTKCNCAKGADDAAQCKGSKAVPILGKITSYEYCCQFATPCDCTKPGFMAEQVSADKLSGIWEGSVPFIIDVQATFDGSAKGHLSVNVKVAKDLIDCPTEDIAEDDSQITFPSVGTVGDCLGDGVRMDNKDPTKYYLIKNSDGTLTFKSDGYPALKMKQKSVEVQDTCSLYEISSDAASCGQSDLNCAYTKYAKAAEKGLVDGTCASQGFSVETGTTTKTYPIIGDIVVTTFSKGLEVQDTCSLYEIASDASSCGQSDLNCAYTKYAKAAEKGLVDGTCASQGFSVETGTTTKTYPIIGDIVVTTFSKGLEVQDTCSLYEIASDASSCGQSDLNCAYTKYAKAAEKGLVDGTCASQGFSVETGTTTKTYPIIGDIVVTTFSKAMLV